MRAELAQAHAGSGTRYYRGQPAFDDILSETARWATTAPSPGAILTGRLFARREPGSAIGSIDIVAMLHCNITMSALLPNAPRISSVDSLGCQTAVLARNERLEAGRAVVLRKASETALHRVETRESTRGILLGIALSGLHKRDIVVDGRTRSFEFTPGAIYLRNFAEPYRAELLNGFDFLLVEMPATAAEGDPAEARALEALPRLQAETDPILPHIAAALLPALGHSQTVSTLFVDQIVVAIQTHLASRFGDLKPPGRQRSLLSHAQEARAKEMLANRLQGDLLVADIAASCGMSRSSFMRAFRATVGTTPHQWLIRQRIETAKALLHDSRVSLAEIGARCGFADQSHFTRVFAARTGVSPGMWRRGG